MHDRCLDKGSREYWGGVSYKLHKWKLSAILRPGILMINIIKGALS
jgi:hypothetical protein